MWCLRSSLSPHTWYLAWKDHAGIKSVPSMNLQAVEWASCRVLSLSYDMCVFNKKQGSERQMLWNCKCLWAAMGSILSSSGSSALRQHYIINKCSHYRGPITRGFLVADSLRWATDLGFHAFRNARLSTIHRLKVNQVLTCVKDNFINILRPVPVGERLILNWKQFLSYGYLWMFTINPSGLPTW